ncbi:MAG: hypothetical protein EON59_11450, partial [Alphaproteobacteria bacterium]
MNERTNEIGVAKRSSRYKMGAVAAVAATGLVGVAIAATSATAESQVEARGSSQAAAALTSRARDTVGTLLARGTVPSAAENSQLKSSPAVTGNNGDLSRARVIDPPAGVEKGSRWFVVPTADATGRACLDTGKSVACGSPELLATSGIATARVDRPDTDARQPRVWAPGGTLTLSGIVPSDIAEVVAVGGSGAVSKR